MKTKRWSVLYFNSKQAQKYIRALDFSTPKREWRRMAILIDGIEI